MLDIGQTFLSTFTGILVQKYFGTNGVFIKIEELAENGCAKKERRKNGLNERKDGRWQRKQASWR
ncbi:MAG: hypothetical protein NPIRA03_25580 [Nitrospirales bacterium]|nr:MAG: hypothetical protein NPIRA03_25580 [Nitrospirales bacterium]